MVALYLDGSREYIIYARCIIYLILLLRLQTILCVAFIITVAVFSVCSTFPNALSVLRISLSVSNATVCSIYKSAIKTTFSLFSNLFCNVFCRILATMKENQTTSKIDLSCLRRLMLIFWSY